MSSDPRSRLLKALGANSVGQVITVVVQIFSVPLLLKFWGVKLYGEWLILSAIPAYLALSDFGFANVTANSMTMLVAKGDGAGALRVFQSSWLFISGVCAVMAGLIVVALPYVPFHDWLNLTLLTHQESSLVFLLLAMNVLLNLQGGLLAAGFRCDGHYAAGQMFVNAARFCEFAGLALAVWAGAQPVFAAGIQLAARAIVLLMMREELRRRSPWIIFGSRHATKATVREMAGPALAFMGMPLGYALNLQGMVMVISAVLGPAAVVVFTATRTLTRVGIQVMTVIAQSVWPEISAAYGAGNLSLARKLHRHSCRVSFWLSLAVIAGLLVCGPRLFQIWTHGELQFDQVLFLTLLAVVAANSFWITSSIVPIAINRHEKMAGVFILANAASLVLAAILLPLWDLSGAALSLLIIDAMMSLYVVATSIKLLGDTTGSYVRAVFALPSLSMLRFNPASAAVSGVQPAISGASGKQEAAP